MNYMKIFLVNIFLITLIGCGGGGGGSENCKPGPDEHCIKYEVSTSTQNVSITYDINGEQVNKLNEDSHNKPWTYRFKAKNGSHLALSAQLLGSGYDTVYVTIYLDGMKVAESKSYSEGVSANTEYDIPSN
jgi:hypothetical protein